MMNILDFSPREIIYIIQHLFRERVSCDVNSVTKLKKIYQNSNDKR